MLQEATPTQSQHYQVQLLKLLGIHTNWIKLLQPLLQSLPTPCRYGMREVQQRLLRVGEWVSTALLFSLFTGHRHTLHLPVRLNSSFLITQGHCRSSRTSLPLWRTYWPFPLSSNDPSDWVCTTCSAGVSSMTQPFVLMWMCMGIAMLAGGWGVLRRHRDWSHIHIVSSSMIFVSTHTYIFNFLRLDKLAIPSHYR